jgi:hypothetical protein
MFADIDEFNLPPGNLFGRCCFSGFQLVDFDFTRGMEIMPCEGALSAWRTASLPP